MVASYRRPRRWDEARSVRRSLMTIVGGLDVRHEALVVRMGVEDPCGPVVVAVG